ncbi:hypothetical protein J437_LFUL010950 [Ladona fulva]|uniref:Uncharacterized protein n=1 Tax=Ladona fulva TaxID=123851 RepID=A0A8K0KKU0_LADFU|nr:hypothetical protein J437_LFUL010950 [Ladona fulva]
MRLKSSSTSASMKQLSLLLFYRPGISTSLSALLTLPSKFAPRSWRMENIYYFQNLYTRPFYHLWTWIDWKSNTKKKFVKARQHLRGTGGGPPSQITLSNVEERLITFLGPSVEKVQKVTWGPSAPRKRKGDILMAGFVDVEERRFRLEEKKADLEERR